MFFSCVCFNFIFSKSVESDFVEKFEEKNVFWKQTKNKQFEKYLSIVRCYCSKIVINEF